MTKTIYLNLEDDITKITARIAKEKAEDLVLVFPKKSFLFSDSINLRLLKKQIDLLGKTAAILTMDEVGQMYAKEAGFSLKFLTKRAGSGRFSDITPPQMEVQQPRGMVRARKIQEPVRTQRPRVEETTILEPEQQLVEEIHLEEPVAMDAATAPVAVHDNFFEQSSGSFSVEQPKIFEVPKKRKMRMRSKYVVASVAAGLIIMVLLALVIIPSATVIVHAKTQTVSRDVELSAATAIREPDSSKLALPATSVQKTVEVSNKFTSVGKREVGSKSQGTVLIYNLSKSPLNLKAATTTLSVGDKTYVFTADQQGIKQVPGANVDSNELRSAQIIATGGGEDFNLPAGTRLEVTNQAFGAQPEFLYAKTQTAIAGGTSRFISLVSEEDYALAQEGLKTKVEQQIRDELKAEGLTFLENANAGVEITEFVADKPVGTESPQFEAKAKVKMTGLAFSQPDLQKLIRQRISQTFPTGKALQDTEKDSLTMKVRNIDINNGILGLSVHYETVALFDLDIGDVRPKISGKTKEEASEILLSRPEVDRVDITLSPAWQSTIPRFSAKIKVEVKK